MIMVTCNTCRFCARCQRGATHLWLQAKHAPDSWWWLQGTPCSPSHYLYVHSCFSFLYLHACTNN
jgi:hypothetical protein